MANAFGLSVAGARLPQQDSSNKTSSSKKIESGANSREESQSPPKSGKMAALKSMLKKDEPAKRAPSIASTSTEAPLLDRNGNHKPVYNTAEMMRGQFRYTSG